MFFTFAFFNGSNQKPMDISHYFNAVDLSGLGSKEEELSKYSVGMAIDRSCENLSAAEIGKYEVAVAGIPYDNGDWKNGAAQAPDKIRAEWYKMPSWEEKLKIIDLGNLKKCKNKKETLLAVRDITDYLNELNVVTVFIGGSQDVTVGICEAFKDNRYFTLSVADAVLDVKERVEKFSSDNFLTRVFRRIPQLFQFNLVAYQKHLVVPELLWKTAGVNQHIRLGQLREKFSNAEPVLRNTDVFSFDTGVVKFTDAPAGKQKNPNGLRSEEACQLAKYAGISSRMKVFGLFETLPENDSVKITTRLAAEIIWYFMEGFSMRHDEDDWNTESKKIYRVEINQLDKPLVFFQDTFTNRWWLEIQGISGEKTIVACSEEEYQRASTNEIPEFWLKYVQKIDEISK